MPRYLIERDVEGAGLMTPAELKAVSQASCRALDELGPRVQWEHSYVTDDRIYCVTARRTKTLCWSIRAVAVSPSTVFPSSPR